jgi:hypothetical protein
MTVREQLAEQASRPGPVLERTCTSLTRPGVYKVLTLPSDWEISLTARMLDPTPLAKLITLGAVNAAEVCGVPAHRLFITKFRVDPPDMANPNAARDHVVRIGLLYCPSPFRGDSEVDFDAILDAIDGELEAPPSESWHDRPSLL